MARGKINLGDVLGDMGAAKGSRITDNLTNSMLDTKQMIKVSLSKVYVSKQIRLKIHQSTVDGIVATYPLHNPVEIRKVTPAIDGDSVPEGYEYVLLAGEHRFRALEVLGFAEHDFSFIPPSIIKTKADVIRYQYEENNVRADMHIVEKANTLARYMEAEGCTQAHAAEVLRITTSLASRLNRINKYLTEDDKEKIIDLDIKSERVIVGIAKLIELGFTDWLSVIRPYALNENGDFDPELIYEKTLTQIIKDLTAPPEPEPEESAAPVAESPKRLADDIIPNAFKEETEQPAPSTAQPTAAATNEPATTAEVVLNPVEAAVENTQENDATYQPSAPQQSSAPFQAETAPTPTDSPASSPASTHPVAKGDEKRASFKLAANVLQQILMGKEVEEILIGLGPDIKKYVTIEDGEDIFGIIQDLPFEQHGA